MGGPGTASRRAAFAARLAAAASVAALALPVAAPAQEPDPPSARAAFAVAYHGQVVPWRQFLLRALPGEAVALRVRPAAEAVGAPDGAAGSLPAGDYALRASAGRVERTGPRSWSWTAPGEPGLHRLVVSAAPDGDSIALTAAVLVPLSAIRGGRVEGYRVGSYPEEVFRGLERYRSPRGFVRVTRHDVDVPVSPRFRLGQFSVRLPSRWPKYTVLHERLLLKLELLVERARPRGVSVRGWKVLSGYRSPWYNRSIGRPRFSRHLFGDAADLYVDVDGDGRMDDLTGDGRATLRDAGVLHALVEAMDGDPALRTLLGGLGAYGTTPTHGPFIHVDTRGYRARW